MKNIFKKISLVLVAAMLVSCTLPSIAFATESSATNVVATVENDPNINLFENYDFSPLKQRVRSARSTTNLAQGNSSFTVGVLASNSTYTTDTYSISKTQIKLVLQSIAGASPHIEVTLYKSNGTSVAVATASLPWSTPLGGGGGQTITFSNLDAKTNYYAVIKNMDTGSTGTILAVAKQA